ncbi:CubicO group peptidase (beta-lactamase class C family) [Mangrovibacterium marinum]|uniref:CubicO group peptidase (Beta-lactamase class C family) n=1 Tax=Mangrovibacterium marinum TaxID=1639118 RepID=A0A2T5BYA3_9BACT|nr:serine hydrolase [Mangrovibacterium marinum]PTN06807.1 CubicO group peptidase (beta-lactamase class C family) [Mangrovibacterium marinum]
MQPKLIKLSPILLLLLLACQTSPRGQYAYQLPQTGDADLPAASLADVGLNTQLIEKVVNRIDRGKFGEVHSLLIYKDGKLVLEEYFEGHDYQWDAPKHHAELVQWTADRAHYAHSVSKSISSLLIGIAVAQGLIDSVQQSVFDYLPDYQYLNVGDKKYLTIEHLLSCTAGLQWAEWNAPLSSRKNDQVNMWFHPRGPVDYYLARPYIAVPGTLFNYCGGGIEVLGEILQNASGMTVQEFSNRYLFGPLGINSAQWAIIYPTGEVHTAGGLKISPRDMLKIGILMLNHGQWHGQQIVPAYWVDKSREPFLPAMDINISGEDLRHTGYSYTWWTKDIRIGGKWVHWFSANGWGGQQIIVLPEIESVIVLTGANYTRKVIQYKILRDYIFPAYDE